jgi:hypothetical protein
LYPDVPAFNRWHYSQIFQQKNAQALQKIGALALKRDDPPQRGDPKPQQALGNW